MMADATEDFTTEELSNALYDQERIAKYLSGEYCPVVLGETFKHGRYRVVHKLGWGGYSTVWLARDEEFSKWVAIKVATAKSSTEDRMTFSASQVQALQDILNHTTDAFDHAGPTGTIHMCSVYTLLGPTVDEVVWDYNLGGDALDPEIIIKLTTQLLRIVARTHGAGIVHGDINGSNLVFEASKVQDLDEAELLDVLGHPETAKIVRKDGHPLPRTLPTHMVEKARWDWPVGWIDEDEEDIRLIDWDQAFESASGSPRTVYQPHDMKAPETILKGQFDHRSDLWQVGCTIYFFIFASRPFWTFANEKSLLEQMDNFVEPFAPEEYQTDQDGQEGLGTNSRQESELERTFRDRVKEPEVKRLLPIIQGLMRINPCDRISAEEALQKLEEGAHDNEA